jgi:hypothetical protein
VKSFHEIERISSLQTPNIFICVASDPLVLISEEKVMRRLVTPKNYESPDQTNKDLKAQNPKSVTTLNMSEREILSCKCQTSSPP